MKQPETPEELAAFEKWQRRDLVSPQEKALRIAQMTAQVEALENGDLPEGFVGLERAGVNKILTARVKATEDHRGDDVHPVESATREDKPKYFVKSLVSVVEVDGRIIWSENQDPSNWDIAAPTEGE